MTNTEQTYPYSHLTLDDWSGKIMLVDGTPCRVVKGPTADGRFDCEREDGFGFTAEQVGPIMAGSMRASWQPDGSRFTGRRGLRMVNRPKSEPSEADDRATIAAIAARRGWTLTPPEPEPHPYHVETLALFYEADGRDGGARAVRGGEYDRQNLRVLAVLASRYAVPGDGA